MEIRYFELAPSTALADIVKCYWFVESGGAGHDFSGNQTCLPRGMVDWIIHLAGDPMQGLTDQGWEDYPMGYFVGTFDRPVTWRIRGATKAMGIRFKPEGVTQLTRCPLREVSNKYLEDEHFIGPLAIPLQERLRSTNDISEQIFLIESFVHGQLSRLNVSPSYFSEALKKIRTSNCSFDKEHLSNSFYLGDRQIQRLFKSNLGMSPKAYEKVVRFGKAVDKMKERQRNWADLAYEIGYADQAHMIRDFKRYSGTTPGAASLRF